MQLFRGPFHLPWRNWTSLNDISDPIKSRGRRRPDGVIVCKNPEGDTGRLRDSHDLQSRRLRIPQANHKRVQQRCKGNTFPDGTDLDTYECPPALIVDWLQRPRHHNLLVRVAVREAEAWILADKQNFADFLGIRSALIPDDVEAIPDPKRELIQLVRRARRRELREDICPPANSTRTVGPNYNSRLSAFVQQHWNPNTARERARSLARTIDRLIAFQPQWPVTDNA